MTYYQKILQVNGLPAFVIKSVIEYDNKLSFHLFEPILPNTAKSFLEDLKKWYKSDRNYLFSFSMEVLNDVGETVISKEYKDVTLLKLDFESLDPSFTNPAVTVVFKI